MSDKALKANLEQHIQGMQSNIDEGRRILEILRDNGVLHAECKSLRGIIKDQRITIGELEQTVKVLEQRLHDIPLPTQYTPLSNYANAEGVNLLLYDGRFSIVRGTDSMHIEIRLPLGWYICEKADT